MHLFAIGDLHLSFGVEKRMNIFEGWGDYEQRIKDNWQKRINAEDVVVVAGDISWGLKLEETIKDFNFLNTLPGKKLIVKGNHDYWWSTAKKIREFWVCHDFNTLDLLHNNAFLFKNIGLCGSRGWLLGEGDEENEKVINRETMRLERSILSALELGAEELIVFLHYPPIFIKQRSEKILEILSNYKEKIKLCCYAHLHGSSIQFAFNKEYEGIPFKLISADALNFEPLQII